MIRHNDMSKKTMRHATVQVFCCAVLVEGIYQECVRGVCEWRLGMRCVSRARVPWFWFWSSSDMVRVPMKRAERLSETSKRWWVYFSIMKGESLYGILKRLSLVNTKEVFGVHLE